MDAYIGTKIVLAEPQGEGYKVMYEDGYVSWSPRGRFEHAYRLVSPKERKLIVEEEVTGQGYSI